MTRSRDPHFWSELRQTIAGKPKDFTTGPIGRAIALLAIPMVLEMMMQSVFALVDTYFVGKLGADPVAVVGLSDSLLTLVFAVALGLAMGTAAMVARRIGEGDSEAAARTAGQALALGAAVSAVIGIAGAMFAPELLRFMGASASVVDTGSVYTSILLGGSSTVFFLFLINAVFRGAGDPFLAMKALWLANLVNIALDPLLIFGWGPIPAMGVTGAAVATTIGRGVGVIYQLWVLTSGRGRITVRPRHLRIDPAITRRLIRISSTGVAQFVVATSSWLGVMKILAIFGSVAVAGYTVAIRLLIFALLPSWGMANAAATLVGQNLGAGLPDRAERSVWLTAAANAFFLLGASVVMITFATPLIGAFTQEPAVIELGVSSLRIISYSYVCFAFGMVTVSAFNGAGDTRTPTWINLACYWLLQIPLAWCLAVPAGMGPTGVFVSVAVSQLVLAVAGVVLFRRGRWRAVIA